MSFNLLDNKIRDLIKERGFLDPSPAQKLAIKPILENKNILLISSTGLGKTEACFLPLLHKLLTEENKPISVLYITPLKSLNRDLEDRMIWWCNKLGLSISIRHGDTTKLERKAQIETPNNILITTPESLGALLVGKRMKEHLRNIKYIVVDEIHEVVGSKRGIQLSLLLERLTQLAGKFQRIGLSATIGSPELAALFLQGSGNPVEIVRAEGNKKYEIIVEDPVPSPADSIHADSFFTAPRTYARVKRIEELMKKYKSTLVFTNTRETAEVLSSRLRKIDKELKQDVHHGSLSKEKRIKSEKDFKGEKLKGMIATSSLELGIDIGSIEMVVQYLSPRQVTRLIQRIGRSGHKIGEISRGVILSGEEDLFESSVISKYLIERKLEEIKIHESALDVLTSQIIGLIFDEYEITEDRLLKIITAAYPYRNFKKEQLSELLKFLESTYMIWTDSGLSRKTIKKRKKSFQYYFENLTMIPDAQRYKVISIIQNEPVGSLDETFVAEYGKTGEKFIFSGRAWRVIQIDGKKLIVEPIEDIESTIPAWVGELIPVPHEIAIEVGKLRKLIQSSLKKSIETKDVIKDVSEKYHTDKKSAEEMIELVEAHIKTHSLPTDKLVLIEKQKDIIIIHMCTGSLVNDSIGRYLAAILTARSGVSVNVKTDPYRIILETTASSEEIKELLESSEKIEEVLRLSLERSQLFKHRFFHVARRFGIISKSAELEKISISRIMKYYENTPVYEETMREILLEKMDILKAEEVLKKIRDQEIKIIIEQGFSLLGSLGLSPKHADIIKAGMPEEEIYKAFRKRLLNTTIRLVCTNCGEYTVVMPVKSVKARPECTKCDSIFIGCLGRRQIDIAKIIKNKKRKKPLTTEELKEFQLARRSADLVVAYGKKACVVLAGHGIGPETAARILSKLHTNKKKLLKDVLEAEKQFARTRVYWKG